jgi:histone acetyltransferase 1
MIIFISSFLLYLFQYITRSDDIRVKLKGSLPDDTIENKEEFLKKLEQQRKTFSPPGKLVHSYKRLVDKVEKHFEIYACPLEDNKKASELHTKMQKMALWFIEGADGIDVNDPRWIIYIVYERTSLQSEQKNHPKDFSPVGFVTLFKFCNPVGRKGNCRPEQIETHRLCQALIYPSYQRQGHGEQVVKFVFEEAVKNDSVYEITVEDPVPAFSRVSS